MALGVNGNITYGSFMAVNPDTTARKLITLPHSMVQEISDFRFANRIKSEAEAIRRLIELGLEAVKQQAATP